MKLLQIIQNLPKLIQVLNLIKDADVSKDRKISIVEGLIVLLKIGAIFVKLPNVTSSVLTSVITYLEQHEADIVSSISELKGG